MKFESAFRSPFLLVLVGTSLMNTARGWSSGGSRNNIDHKSYTKSSGTVVLSSNNGIRVTTRRDAVHKTLTTLVGGVAASTGLLSSTLSTPTTRFGMVQAAHADVTNKIASSTALRALTRAQAQLPTKLLPEAQSNNFVGVKARLREPPFDLMRKNGLILVRGGEDGPMAKELLKAYKALIASIEKIDATASLGMRGREVDPFEMSQEYDAISAALDCFLKVGGEAAEIPLQERPSMQDNLKYGSIDTKVLKGY
mmetsp:Transcript_2396/g.5017  ORF Transcript_2396/g.5017 Transcript_2396/m.5017 type:complete len:254 (-) Transcript_2396:260-1021(-)|eukprot:CAMPEP_0201143546 /NCGR_PEP_ID=MMETSP0851-20130426/5264_1 /ASSEMBLY_ACC=CAM_ASM_000631 /TAXON_ID=183588 /ORGANISM="Pseudo-nitzschia fraudulenta, Strain WWA7" /LENGTH=253 /DNA_ID=CAMNT_0047417839 /DNA_START=17 /DNA_END=778 /DNA_ORIENTATION=+